MVTTRVVLGVTGGIAAYKATEIIRGLTAADASVQVMMTEAATQFITPLTLSVLSKHPVISSLWDASSGAVDHIDLARRTDVLAVAPATANMLGKLARGIADDVVSTYAVAHRGTLVIAPAMNTWMWSHEATRESLSILRRHGAVIVDPESGELACGDTGPGRMASPEKIVAAILEAGRTSHQFEGKAVVITAGPTREPLDPVRFLSNRSSGRMGYALAREAAKRAARVVLITGPVVLEPPAGVEVVRVERTQDMLDAVLAALPSSDALIMAAAPADFVAAVPANEKIKRSAGPPTISLALAPDILRAAASVRKPGQVLVGFAAETTDVVLNSRQKLLDKKIDLLVANDVSNPEIGFDSHYNEVLLLSRPQHAGGDIQEEFIPKEHKALIAGKILDAVARLLGEK